MKFQVLLLVSVVAFLAGISNALETGKIVATKAETQKEQLGIMYVPTIHTVDDSLLDEQELEILDEKVIKDLAVPTASKQQQEDNNDEDGTVRHTIVIVTTAPKWALVFVEWFIDATLLLVLCKLVQFCGFEIEFRIWHQVLITGLGISLMVCMSDTQFFRLYAPPFVGVSLEWFNSHFQLFRHTGCEVWLDFIWITFKLLAMRVLLGAVFFLVRESIAVGRECRRRITDPEEDEQQAACAKCQLAERRIHYLCTTV